MTRTTFDDVFDGGVIDLTRVDPGRRPRPPTDVPKLDRKALERLLAAITEVDR